MLAFPRQMLVVIPTLNEADHIEGVINELSRELPSEVGVHFAIVDGGSTDATVAIVRRLALTRRDLTLLHNPQRIQSAAVNLAVKALGTGSDFVVRCDAHALYPAGFLRNLVASADRSGADAVVVPMDSVGNQCLQRAIAWVSDTRIGSGGSAHRGGSKSGFVDHGHHALFRLETFLRAGGYDSTFTHNEDAELDCRQRALGSRIFLDAKIRLIYSPRKSVRDLAKQYFNYGKGRSRTVRRHPNSLRARQLAIPIHLILASISLLLGFLDWRFLFWPSLYSIILITTSTMVAVRHKSLCGLLAGPSAFIIHTAWGLGFLWGYACIRESRWKPQQSETA